MDDKITSKDQITKNNDTDKFSYSTVRHCTIKESIEDSLKEVKDIREGKKQGMSLDELFDKIDKWSKEDRG